MSYHFSRYLIFSYRCHYNNKFVGVRHRTGWERSKGTENPISWAAIWSGMVTYSSYIGSWQSVLAVSWDSHLQGNWKFIIFLAPKEKAGLCCHWIRRVPVSPTDAVGKIKSDLTNPLRSSPLMTLSQIGKLPATREMGCHPPQRGISSLSLYSEHYLDGKVGGLAVGGWRGGEQVSGLCYHHHHHSLSQHWLSLGPHGTFGSSSLLDKSSPRGSEAQDLSEKDPISECVWRHFTDYVMRNWGAGCPVFLSSGSWTHQTSLCTLALHLPLHFYLFPPPCNPVRESNLKSTNL